MITIDITINDSGKVTDVIMDGHANHGEYGHDIVCALLQRFYLEALMQF